MKRTAGYTLLELTITMALFTVGSGAALVQLQSSLTAVDSDVASNMVVYHLRLAREASVDERRPMLMEFIAPRTIKLTRLDGGGGQTVISEVTLPPNFSFGLPTGMDDTPQTYGNSAAVDFNGQSSGTFLSDGIFVDQDGNLVSGTVYTIGPNGNPSARAITLSGASGRVKQYFIKDNAWAERTSLHQ